MPEKDFYKILNVHPAATPGDIRKAYRQLAMKYHPDKNAGSQFAAKKFTEVQEAYETLKDAGKRAAYHFRQPGRHFRKDNPPLANSVQDVLESCITMQKKIDSQDPYRLDRDQLLYSLHEFLSDHNLHLLTLSGDYTIKLGITKLVVSIAQTLPPVEFDKISYKLLALPQTESEKKVFNRMIHHARFRSFLGRNTIWIALIAALLACLFINLLV